MANGAGMVRSPLPRLDPPAYGRVKGYEKADIKQIQLFCGHPFALKRSVKDYYAFTVFNCAFGESMSSRLFQDLREKSGLCYSVYSTFSLDRSLGLWMASASSSPRLFPRLLEGLDRQIDRLASGGEGELTEEEIGESVSRIVGSFDLALEDPEYRMRRLARMKLCDGPVADTDSAMARFLAVGPSEVAELASRLFKGRERAVFAYGKATVGVGKAMGRTNG
jgi:predicted Zn-dependent peptidase